MRNQARSLVRYIALALALVVVAGTHASGDDRTEARTHYQAGVKAYNGSDYRTAIREFSAAQQLAPADLNNYNLALCYDKLGDAEPAVQYYRAYLDKAPGTDKRAEIEASIARLEAAAKSVAAKQAAEARKAEQARAAAEAKKAAEEAKLADNARKADEAKRAADAKAEAKLEAEAKRRPPTPPIDDRDDKDDKIVEPGLPVATGAGSTGTPGTGTHATTGDAQLDRVSQIDINAIRDQRFGGAASGMADNRGGPAASGSTADASGAGAAPPNAAGPPPPPNPLDQPAKAAPIYTKWWFWVIAGVATYVVYRIATDDSSQSTFRQELPLGSKMAPGDPSGGLTLMRW